MSYICDICGKQSCEGGSHKHHRGVAGGQWKRRAQHTKREIRPNLHFVTIPVAGMMSRVRACAKCIKRARFDSKKAKESVAPAVVKA